MIRQDQVGQSHGGWIVEQIYHDVELQLFERLVMETCSGRLPGKDRGRTIVVGAHYDHLGQGGEGSLAPNEIGAIHHGADDNASGTAAVLEIARLALARGAPACDLVFALWSGEEEGLLGSDHWAGHPTVPLAQVSANLNLDMVGRAGNGKLQVLGAGTAPEFVALLEQANAAELLELAVSTSGATLGGSSDHQSFLKRGIRRSSSSRACTPTTTSRATPRTSSRPRAPPRSRRSASSS